MRSFFYRSSVLILLLLALNGCTQQASEKEEPAAPAKAVETMKAETPAVSAQSSSAGVGGLSGKINFKGQVPAMEKLNLAADPVCAASGELSDESLVVGSAGEVQNAFIYIKEGLPPGNYDSPQTPVTLDQHGCHYVPHVLGMQTGQELQIINSDTTLHNVHAMPVKSSEFNLGMPIKGMKLKKKITTPEIMVKFKCDVHPWMSAYVGVLEHPFFSVSAADGTFRIENIPAGDYVVGVWHEKLGTQEQSVKIESGKDTMLEISF
ncbi:MAG: hypothetical protein H6757_02675 [Candidatus Omnitrophica bacterium]|nr:hypothetical protein [Candidatus Omnitrophota bacterium]